jgi:hypothetical protein
MFGFNSDKDNKFIKPLLQGMDFKFDQAGIKNRLLTSMTYSQSSSSFVQKKFLYKRVSLTFGTVALILFFSSTCVYADHTKPGDKLYFLDQFQEQVGLRLSRTAAEKAKLKSKIINERLQEISEFKNNDPSTQSLRLESIEKTQANIIQTVDETAAIKQRLTSTGHKNSTNQVDQVLNQLEELAGRQQLQMEQVKSEIDDDAINLKIENNILEIKKARNKARVEAETGGSSEKNDSGE